MTVDTQGRAKRKVEDLAFLGGHKLFSTTKSTSSLRQPDFLRFMDYSREFFDRQYYTNNGVLVRQLERRLAEFHDTRYCVAFCSGFWALALAMSALALPGKREVVMPSLTYRRLADVAAWARLVPRFCEVDAETLGASAATIAECLNGDSALIVAVHPIVNCCDIDGIVKLGKDRGIPVLIDSVEWCMSG